MRYTPNPIGSTTLPSNDSSVNAASCNSSSNSSRKEEKESLNKRKSDQTDSQENHAKKIKTFSNTCTNEGTCPICYHHFIEPRVLECGHNFCKGCLYEWLAKSRSCPLCRTKLCRSSHPSTRLEVIVENCVKTLPQGDRDEREERKKIVQTKFDQDLAKLHAMIENAKAKKINFLNINAPWKLEEKRTFSNGVRLYFGKCREDFCALVGLTEDYCKNCTNEELVRACDNLEISTRSLKSITTDSTTERVIDFELTRQRLLKYWRACDNLFI